MKTHNVSRKSVISNKGHSKSNDLVVSAILKRLLADVSKHTGVLIEAPDGLDDTWCINNAPKLSKEILAFCNGLTGIAFLNEREPRLKEVFNELGGSFLLPLVDAWLEESRNRLYAERYYDDKDKTSRVVDAMNETRSNEIRLFKGLYQVLLFGYKAEQSPTKEQIDEANKAFVETDENVLVWELSRERTPGSYLQVLLREARKLCNVVIHKADFGDITGRHGPGGVYPRRLPSDKSGFATYYHAIHKHYDFCDHFCGLPHYWEEALRVTAEVAEGEAIVAKLCAVPKDSRGPRLISVHPTESVWVQLGQASVLMRAIERSRLTAGYVNFTSQEVNRSLALTGSNSGQWATLDLREASDRISCHIVKSLFGDWLYEKLSCSRATHYLDLNGEQRTMYKWAPMGNGLTFPVQSLVFWSLVTAGIRLGVGTKADVHVYVFGDDIIVNPDHVQYAVKALTTCGLKLNDSKCFLRGPFRESCGMDAYLGIQVTPVRVKKGLRCASWADVVSLCDLAKRLKIAGYHLTASYVYDRVNRVCGPLPKSNNPAYSGAYEYVTAELALLLQNQETYFHKSWHEWGVKVRSVGGAKMHPLKDEWFHLQDSLLRLGVQHSPDECLSGWEERKLLPLERDSDRRFAYPIPYEGRLVKGFVPHLLK